MAELDRQFGAAEATRAGLKQPADLAPVYGAAYEHDVPGPARAFRGALPPTQVALAKSAALADQLTQNRTRLKLDGALAQVADPALRQDVHARMSGREIGRSWGRCSA